MSNAPKFPSEVEFASFLVYSPRGTSEVSKRSQRVMRMVKFDPGQFANHIPRMKTELSDAIIQKFLLSSTTLVPTPKSAPMKDPSSRWVARELCSAMVGCGLGSNVVPCLSRIRPVQKSATAAPGERPSVLEHYDSMLVGANVDAGPFITVVDDVLTRGRTMLAAVARVQQAFPAATVRGFAVIRTMGLVSDIDRVLEPCEGVVAWDGVDARRSP